MRSRELSIARQPAAAVMAFGSHPTSRSFSRRLVTDALRNATRTVSEVSEMSSIHLLNPRVQAMRVDANRDPDAFWAQAASSLHWNRGWTKVFDWDAEKPDDPGENSEPVQIPLHDGR